MPTFFLFVSLSAHGHLGPLLAPALRLQEQGHTVAVASRTDAQERVQQAGLPFVDLGPPPENSEQSQQAREQAFDPEQRDPKAAAQGAASRFADAEKHMASTLLPYIEGLQHKPDVLVTDFLTFAGFDAAEKFSIPAVVAGCVPLSLFLMIAGCSSYNLRWNVPAESMGPVFPERMSLLQRLLNPYLKRQIPKGMAALFLPRRNEVRAQLGLPPQTGAPAELEGRVPRVMYMDGITWDLEVERPLPPNWRLVGPMGAEFSVNYPPPLTDAALLEFFQEAAAAGEPVVYVAFGTVVSMPKHLAVTIAAGLAAMQGVRFLWSLPQAQQAHLEGAHLPQHLLLPAWTPQPAVLGHPAVKAFVTHGGMNSTNEGLAAGKPLLCMPFGADQFVNAMHIENKLVGLQLSAKGLQPQLLTSHLRRVLEEHAFAAAAAAMGERMRRESGPDKAAQVLLEFAEGNIWKTRPRPNAALGRPVGRQRP